MTTETSFGPLPVSGIHSVELDPIAVAESLESRAEILIAQFHAPLKVALQQAAQTIRLQHAKIKSFENNVQR